jgi:RimJ/RimL family protein N-acetyltransferase
MKKLSSPEGHAVADNPFMERARLTWTWGGHIFEAIEPDDALVAEHAVVLRDWYNAADNAVMMDGSGDMTEDDVRVFWRELRSNGGRGFFGFVDGVLVGDADLRNVSATAAEFAIMIGDAAQKGRGVGRTLATIVHVFAFRELGLRRLFVPPRHDNVRVHALNAFLGYTRDDSAEARAYADGPDCETYSLASAEFQAAHEAAWRAVTLTVA